MAVPFLNHLENPLNLQKFKKYPKNSNLKPFWAFLLSVFIYSSVFYAFNLSPSNLLSTPKFWFIISNTLILIIATDFAAFSAPKEHHLYDEYMKNNVRSNSTIVPSFEIQYVKIEKTMPENQREQVGEQPHEKIIEMVEDDSSADHCKNQETPENKPAEIFITNQNDDQKEKPTEKSEEKMQEVTRVKPEVENGKKRETKCLRSNSDKAILVAAAAAAENEGKMMLPRTLSEGHEEPMLEENEFSRMSDEELNRRVEEFIRSFNRQIRLQAAKNRHNLEGHRF